LRARNRCFHNVPKGVGTADMQEANIEKLSEDIKPKDKSAKKPEIGGGLGEKCRPPPALRKEAKKREFGHPQGLGRKEITR